jgi:transposase-like protein
MTAAFDPICITSIMVGTAAIASLPLLYLRREDPMRKFIQVRGSQYLNNLIERDRRTVKRRCASMGGFKSLGSAAPCSAWIYIKFADQWK